MQRLEGQWLPGAGERSTTDPREDAWPLISVRKSTVSFAAEESVADHSSPVGKQALEQPRPACLSAAGDCADAMMRQDVVRESMLCSHREGMISGEAETSRVNHSYRHFFLV